MAKTPEGRLQDKCLKYVKEQESQGRPIFAINQHGGAFSSRGIPDLIMCIRGKFVAVELKVGDNKPTPLQESKILRIQKALGQAYVCYTFDEFKTVVEHEIH